MRTLTGGRPRIRTAELSAELRERLLDAFGTVWNAYRQLNLSDTSVSFSTFSRAHRGLPISPEQLNGIVTAWETRRRQPVSA